MAEIVATNIVASQPPDGNRVKRRHSCQYCQQMQKTWPILLTIRYPEYVTPILPDL